MVWRRRRSAIACTDSDTATFRAVSRIRVSPVVDSLSFRARGFGRPRLQNVSMTMADQTGSARNAEDYSTTEILRVFRAFLPRVARHQRFKNWTSAGFETRHPPHLTVLAA